MTTTSVEVLNSRPHGGDMWVATVGLSPETSDAILAMSSLGVAPRAMSLGAWQKLVRPTATIRHGGDQSAMGISVPCFFRRAAFALLFGHAPTTEPVVYPQLRDSDDEVAVEA